LKETLYRPYLILPVTALDSTHIHHVRVREVLLVALLNDVARLTVVVLPAAVIIEVLPDVLRAIRC
jgi:hypothetical protein